MEIDVGAALAQEIGEKLSSTHANSIVSMLAERDVLKVFRERRVESLIEFMKESRLAEIHVLHAADPIDFFFSSRSIIRAPSVLALSGVTSGCVA